MSDDKPSDTRTQPAPVYTLKEWCSSIGGGSQGWTSIATSEDVHALVARGSQLGLPGEDWTIKCACGATSTFHGCRSSAHG